MLYNRTVPCNFNVVTNDWIIYNDQIPDLQTLNAGKIQTHHSKHRLKSWVENRIQINLNLSVFVKYKSLWTSDLR